MSDIKQKLKEAIAEDSAGEDWAIRIEDIDDECIREILFTTSITREYMNEHEIRCISEIGGRFFRYIKNHLGDYDITEIEEVEPYQEIVTKYRHK